MGKIEDAIKKINTEIQKEPSNRYLALVGEHIIDNITSEAAGSSGITGFKVHFEAVQGEINKMLTCIDGVEESEGKEEADKLRKALQSLCRSVQDNL